MNTVSQYIRKFLSYLAMAIFMLLILCVGRFFIVNNIVCITDEERTIYTNTHIDLKMSRTNCDSLGNDENISVYASETPGWNHIELPRYAPSDDNVKPYVYVMKNDIYIVVSKVSSVIKTQHHWNKYEIHFVFGSIDYGDASGYIGVLAR